MSPSVAAAPVRRASGAPSGHRTIACEKPIGGFVSVAGVWAASGRAVTAAAKTRARSIGEKLTASGMEGASLVRSRTSTIVVMYWDGESMSRIAMVSALLLGVALSPGASVVHAQGPA